MKKLAVALAVVLLVALIVWRLWPHSAPSSSRAVPAQSQAGRGSAAPSRVRRLSPDERKQLGAKIQAAIQREVERARAARSGRGAAPSPTGAAGTTGTPDDIPNIALEQVAKPMQEALQAAIPLLADCFTKHDGNTAAALMTMTSDPELGTVIDTDAINDADGKPLDPKVDSCLRDTIDSLALPPLGQLGKLNIQYTFRFDE
ncbi:MAG TPA: hypothetical protein VIV40_12905 [Kofleriaceae bacterium]